MNSPISQQWTVEYHFCSDSFSVRCFSEYLTDAQQSFHSGRFFDSIILALHPTEDGARDECEVWQERRNCSPISPKDRAAQLRQYVEGLESYPEQG